MIRALLFDFDGTLADSFGAITASTNFVREKYGLGPLTEAEVRTAVGHGLLKLVERLVPNADPLEVAALYRQHHPSVMLSGTRLMAGAMETLQTLQSQGRRMAVCSNKPVHFTKALVDGLGVTPYFEAVLGPEDVPNPKPDPAMLLEGARRLEVSANEAVYVGDMEIDVKAARAAGMPAWILAGSDAGTEPLNIQPPDRLFNSFRDILSLVG
jgi:phosphoglycolate phosphatase